MVDIDKFIKHHQKINETVENNVNTQIRKNTKPTANKRKKSKSNTVKRGLFDETAMTVEPKISVNVQSSTVNSGKRYVIFILPVSISEKIPRKYSPLYF